MTTLLVYAGLVVAAAAALLVGGPAGVAIFLGANVAGIVALYRSGRA